MIEHAFAAVFGSPPVSKGFAPGRVNLIGEHIDYNGGLVLPAALPVALEVAFGQCDDNKAVIATDRFDGIRTLSLSSGKSGDWSDYALGALAYAHRLGWLQSGASLYISSTIPDGAGLSSSAALVVAILKAVRESIGATVSDTDIAILARRVENEFIGVPCGIMDQMAVAVATPGQAISLNTATLEYTPVDLPTDYHMAVVHSGQTRKLSDGRYRARKEECDAAKSRFETDDLCHLTVERVLQSDLPNNLKRRVRHCITEHDRTVAAADALARRNMDRFGALMIESHASMREDFEMSTPIIDALVADAVALGAIGARLTGGGFGGCIVTAVKRAELERWRKALLAKHPNARSVC